MPSPDISKDDIRRAIQLFDATYRDSPGWRDWETKRNHIHAIEHGDKLYPVKMIVSLASGLPRTELNGGFAGGSAANPVVDKLGFKLVRLRPPRPRNPAWSRDERILVLDAYLRWRGNPPDKSSPKIAALSNDLRTLAIRLGVEGEADFRNANGVYLKLMNFRSLDPRFKARGQSGMINLAQGDIEVWEEFSSDPDRCEDAARLIRAFITNDEPLPIDFPDEVVEAEEGKLLTRVHIARERNRAIVETKKKRVLAKFGRLVCEACGFDFAARYPGHGDGFIECHHERPISTLMPGEKTRIEDLVLLCSNCHRMVHSKRPWLTVQELRDRFF